MNKLTISDLKAALDFVREDLKDITEKAQKENISPNQIPAYTEVKKVENDLYHKLLNITRSIT